jgi:hypothetical protein
MGSKIFCTAVAALLLSGCVTVKNKPLDENASNNLEQKTLKSSLYPVPDFSAMTAGKAGFGLFGALAMIHSGNAIVHDDGIVDPAVRISGDLKEKLRNTRHMNIMDNDEVKASSDNIPALVGSYPDADYLLDVKTVYWSFVYYPTNWSHYRVLYTARMRLINEANGSVAAETMCKAQPGDDKDPPTKDQLLAEHGALLKQLLDKAADSCANLFASQILHI